MENFICRLKNDFKLGKLKHLSSNVKTDDSIVPKSYRAFLALTNGTSIDNAMIQFDIQSRTVEEHLCNFMSYEEFISNDYLEVKLEYFDENFEIGKERDVEAWNNIKSLSDRYKVFCSTSINSLFAFDIKTESFGEVYYLDLDHFPFTAYKVFINFEEFIMSLESIENETNKTTKFS